MGRKIWVRLWCIPWRIANCLARMPNTKGKTELVLLLAEIFKRDSAKFDTEKFIDASGI